MKYIVFISFALILPACSSTQSQNKTLNLSSEMKSYWYDGEAEITSYELQQARYGEIHSGEAVLVFVTEPFSKSKQVKLDVWDGEDLDNVSVMKLNMTKKFLTGIYPYSMMMSTFVPVGTDSSPLKVTMSSQEWCGHTYMQLNLKKDRYRLNSYSYFESEGDAESDIQKTILEDELWTHIRWNPDELPQGEIMILPGTFYLRLRHQEANPQKATVELENMPLSEFSSSAHKKYSLNYENRSLSIYFESTFPYTILGWEESHMSGFGEPKKLTTTAKRINTIKSAYWNKNSKADRIIRKELGLSLE